MIDSFLIRADTVLGAGYSAVLSGSAVRGDHRPGRSDYNLLVVAEHMSPADLRGLGPELARFARERVGPPLLVTRVEWARAADSFPIEITDIRTAYRVVRGTDPLTGLTVRPADLRRALETEYRGKLLRLRAEFGLHAADPAALAATVGHSIGSLRVLFRTTVVLAGHTAPATDADLATRIAALLGVDHGPLMDLFAHRRDTAWQAEPSLFEAYLGVVESATRFIDQYHAGEH